MARAPSLDGSRQGWPVTRHQRRLTISHGSENSRRSETAMSNGSSQQPGEVLRLRNLAMIENIRRAEDPAWRDWLERQQVVARLGRRFGREATPLEAMLEHATLSRTSCGRPLFRGARMPAEASGTADSGARLYRVRRGQGFRDRVDASVTAVVGHGGFLGEARHARRQGLVAGRAEDI